MPFITSHAPPPALLLRCKSFKLEQAMNFHASSPSSSGSSSSSSLHLHLHLDRSKSARSLKPPDLQTCVEEARLALKVDHTSKKAWFFLCWALFEMKRYDDARAETERALAHRSWALRDREGVAALRSSCRLLSGLTTAVGDQLRDGWYRKRLRALYEAGTLREYETEPMPGRGPDFHKRLGVDQNELSLLDNVSARELRDVDLGGDGNARRNIPAGTLEGGNSSNERDPLNACFGGDKFPLEQGLGGVVFLKHAILPFHCDQRLGAESEFAELEASGEGWRRNPRSCYTGNGPCYSCCSDDFPQPTHSFPAWVPALPPGATVTAPHSEMDVFYSKDAVPPRLKQQLTSVLDTLGKKRRHFPMPHYHNIVDPNVNVGADGLWVPTEFDVLRVPLVPVEIAALVELACLESTGQRMPFPIGHVIVELANGDGTETRGECAMRTPIPDLDPHENFKLHLAMQRLMTCALPLLGRLRRPALLLPGPLQAVVKAQRIFLDEGEDYAGVWHEDGMDEHIVAVVLYYYRAAENLQGGSLEFCSKQKSTLWDPAYGGTVGTVASLAASLPRCKVPVGEGTLVCFSNYAAVHRVLRMEAARGGGSRDFVAFFIIDQRHPLQTPAQLAPFEERMQASANILKRQLKPRGTFGLDSTSVYSTGNGAVADIGWINNGGNNGGIVGETMPESVTLINRLNLAPPSLDRGLSMMIDEPLPMHQLKDFKYGVWEEQDVEPVEYNPASSWMEVWVGQHSERQNVEPWWENVYRWVNSEDSEDEGRPTVLYVDTSLRDPFTLEPPDDGVSEVRTFPGGFGEFRAFCEAEGYYTDDDALQARLRSAAE